MFIGTFALQATRAPTCFASLASAALAFSSAFFASISRKSATLNFCFHSSRDVPLGSVVPWNILFQRVRQMLTMSRLTSANFVQRDCRRGLPQPRGHWPRASKGAHAGRTPRGAPLGDRRAPSSSAPSRPWRPRPARRVRGSSRPGLWAWEVDATSVGPRRVHKVSHRRPVFVVMV